MFVDAVWVHLLVFAVGQACAWLYARSGRFGPGAAATVCLWVAVDWWLVVRYLLAADAQGQLAPLALLYAAAGLTSGVFAASLFVPARVGMRCASVGWDIPGTSRAAA